VQNAQSDCDHQLVVFVETKNGPNSVNCCELEIISDNSNR